MSSYAKKLQIFLNLNQKILKRIDFPYILGAIVFRLLYYRGPGRSLLHHIIKQAGDIDNKTSPTTSKSHETTKTSKHIQTSWRSKNPSRTCAPEWTEVWGGAPLAAHSRLCNLPRPFHSLNKCFPCWRRIAVGGGRSISATGKGNIWGAWSGLAPLISSRRRPQSEAHTLWAYPHGYSYHLKPQTGY